MLKRLRKINKAKWIESSRRESPTAPLNIPLPRTYVALLAAGVPKAKAALMVQDADNRGGNDVANLWRVVVWASTPYRDEWWAAAKQQ